jgi:hypothetical protein
MVMVSDIVQITITVQSAAIARRGFNSLLILGAPASFGVGWDDYEVRSYTSYQQVAGDTDIEVNAPVRAMAATAFAQSPRVPTVYIAKGTAAGIGADLPATDLDQVVLQNNLWFGLVMESTTPAAINSAIPWVAANKRYGFFRIDSLTTLPTALSNYSSVWYSDSVDTVLKYLDVAAASRVLSYVPGRITAAYKTLENVVPTNPSTTDEADLLAAHINWYPTVGGRNVTYQGWSHNTQQAFIDTYIGALYLEARMMEDVWGLMASVDKIPYTNAGINSVVNVVSARLQQSINDGYLTNDPAPVIDYPLASEVSQVDKSNRLYGVIEFIAYTAGAIHQVQINGTIIA